MIESIEFFNFKALRRTTLPLAPFTLLLGPNGSGKTSVLQAIQGIGKNARSGSPSGLSWASLLSVSAPDEAAAVQIQLRLRLKQQVILATVKWQKTGHEALHLVYENGGKVSTEDDNAARKWLSGIETFALDFAAIARPVHVKSGAMLESNGGELAAVLDDLQGSHPERWDALLAEMCHWLPEYDQVLFDKPQPGQKGIVLRTKKGGHRIPAKELSQGTLVALALLTLAYLPDPPSLVGLEEIDRGLHPRLLRHLQDALYRLSYPESCGETRPPIQVIATTHSPYLLDLYRDHPEEVVLARKAGLEVEMKRLTDIEHYEEILGESPLSEVWYSGVLGGATVKP